MRKRKEARPFRPRLLLPNVQHLVVTIAVAKGTHRSRSDPALVGAGRIWANSDQKRGFVQVPGMVLNVPEKSASPARLEAWRCGENGLIGLARIANQRALDLINPDRVPVAFPPFNTRSIDIEGNMSGR